MKKYSSVTSVWQQVGGQQAGEARVQQPGAFLDPGTRAALGRTAGARAAGERQTNGSPCWNRMRLTASRAGRGRRWAWWELFTFLFSFLLCHKIKRSISIVFIWSGEWETSCSAWTCLYEETFLTGSFSCRRDSIYGAVNIEATHILSKNVLQKKSHCNKST